MQKSSLSFNQLWNPFLCFEQENKNAKNLAEIVDKF